MGALASQFGQSLGLSVVVGAAVLIVVAVVARRAAARRQPALPDVLRVASVGWVVVVVVATALPHAWPPRLSADGDLVLELGRGGLAEWRTLIDDPLSWTAFLLVANVAAYVPLGFLGVLAWPDRAPLVVLAGVIVSVLVETTQFTLTERVASTDDVLLNATGVLAGALLGSAVHAFARRSGST